MDSFGRPIVRQEKLINDKTTYLAHVDKAIRAYLDAPIKIGRYSEVNYRKKFFPVVHISAYCQDNLIRPINVIPAEYAMGYFSLKHGLNDIDDTLHGFVNPILTPIGLLADVVEQSKILKIPAIDQHHYYHLKESNAEELLIKLDKLFSMKRINDNYLIRERFVDVDVKVIDRPGMRLIFSARDDCAIVSAAIRWCQEQVPRTNTNLHLFQRYIVIPLGTVLRIFSEYACEEFPQINRIPCDADASTIIDHHKFMYHEGMSCKWHSKPENEMYELCSFNMVRRMMYNVIKYFAKTYDAITVPQHTPFVKKGDDYAKTFRLFQED